MHELSLAGHFKVLGVVIAASITFVLVGQNVRLGSSAPSVERIEAPGYERRVPPEQPRLPAVILVAYQAGPAR